MGLGAIGVWIGLSLGTAVYAGLLLWRFHCSRRGAICRRCRRRRELPPVRVIPAPLASEACEREQAGTHALHDSLP